MRLDGADIYAWPRTELSRYVGYLPQDVELFSGTVRENIARMNEGDPESVVTRRAARAGAHEMILRLPKGYDTEIGPPRPRGSPAARRSASASRARFTAIPTSSCSTSPIPISIRMGEEALLLTLAGLKQDGVTVVVVAHRPSILAGVDKILVLRPDGTVEAFGPRAEVVQQFTRRANPASPAGPTPPPPSTEVAKT